MIWHSSEINDVLKELDVSPENGLANGVADSRLQKYGKNALQNIKKPSFSRNFIKQLNNKLVYFLCVIAILSFVLSVIYQKNDIFSPLLIIGVVLLNSLISAYQLYKSESALNSLKSIASPLATVLREGIEKQISSSELVPGDIIIVKSGDCIPADARIIENYNLACNEYILTGEDIPVNKKSDIYTDDIAPISERLNMVFSGCIAVHGSAKAVVVETGLNTEIGKNSSLVEQTGDYTLPIQSRLESTGKITNIIIFGICVFVFAIELFFNFKNPHFAQTTTSALLDAIALAVAAIPEGLPAISLLAVALGIERIIRDDIIIKKAKALEFIGKTSVICSDKTGIITKNSMNVVRIFDGEESVVLDGTDLCEKHKMVLRLASNCSMLENDSTENAIKNACAKHCGLTLDELDNLFPRVAEIPFDSARKTMTSINLIDGKPFAIVKGAPEIMAYKLQNISPQVIEKQNELMAEEALRVICIALKPLDEIPLNPLPEIIENDLLFVGLLGIDDPPRASTIDAIDICDKAGIRTIMITGDNLITAKAVARRVGILKDGTKAISGADLSEMSDDELKTKIKEYSVFARITPDDKLRIIKALQDSGETVTVTGDDFRDVQALANADIGCAMGKLGNDVARNNADIIIKNSYFDSIISAIKESRGLFANIQKTVAFLLSCNLAEVLAYIIGLLIFKKPTISASQLLWINLLTDSAPVIALATEKAEDNVMSKKPLSLSGWLFDSRSLVDIILQSLFIMSMSLLSFFIGYSSNNMSVAMTMMFTTLALLQIFHSLNLKTTKTVFKTKFGFNDFFTISAVLIVFVICFLVLTPAGIVFGLEVLSAKQFFISLGLAFLVIPFCEILKIIKKFSD